jgi:hypothetical protein
MLRRSHEVGEHRRSRSGRARRYGGGMVIAGSAAGALWALGVSSATAPQAHADLEDLIIQPVIDAVSQAFSGVEPGLLSVLDSSGDLSGLFNSLDSTLGLGGLSTHTLAETAAGSDASVPLQTLGGTEPIVDLSVNGGGETPVLVDTGSNGLVIPIQDIGFQTLSLPTSAGFGSYSGGLDYFYLTFDLPVNFGDGVTTTSPVDVALFEFPTTLSGAENFNQFLGGTGDGILGIGPNSAGPGPDFVLPGGNEGVLINEGTNAAPGSLLFGENPNPLDAGTPLNGAPISDAYVSINGGTPVEVATDFDSGGVYGSIPESALAGSGVTADSAGTLPPGTEIAVYAEPGKSDLLYDYKIPDASESPTVVSSGDFDTGNEPFSQGPIYIDTNGSGDTVFDYVPSPVNVTS